MKKRSIMFEEVIDEVHRLDPALAETDETFKVAVLLLSLTVVGPSQKRLHKFTGYPEQFIRTILSRLRKNGVITSGNGLAVDWFKRGEGRLGVLGRCFGGRGTARTGTDGSVRT